MESKKPWDEAAFREHLLGHQGVEFVRLDEPKDAHAWRLHRDRRSRQAVYLAWVAAICLEVDSFFCALDRRIPSENIVDDGPGVWRQAR